MDQSYFMTAIPSQPKRDEKASIFFLRMWFREESSKACSMLKLMQPNILWTVPYGLTYRINVLKEKNNEILKQTSLNYLLRLKNDTMIV